MQLRGLGNVRPIVLEQALSQEIKPLGVDVQGKEMVLLSVNDGTKQSLLIAEANCKATLDFVLPHHAQPNEVRLEPVSPPEFLQGRPGLARGLDEQGDLPATFFGTLHMIKAEDEGLTLLPSRGQISPGAQWLTGVKESNLRQFRDGTDSRPLIPASLTWNLTRSSSTTPV